MNVDFIINLMKKLSFPSESIDFLAEKYDKLLGNNDYHNVLSSCRDLYFSGDGSSYVKDNLKEISEKSKIHIYTVHFIFLLYCSEKLRKLYIEKGLGNELFENLMIDLRCKLIECHDVYSIWGTFVFFWFQRHFLVDRFALGRFQYEKADFDYDEYEVDGFTMKRGDTVYNFHIPSCGPIPWDARLNSYKLAYNFFAENNKPVAFVCESWLLYPSYKDVFLKDSNIRSFVDDFTILKYGKSENFDDRWRVFKKPNELPISALPSDTRLQRAFLDYMKNGGTFGWGYGIIVFDKNKILK